MKAQKFILRLLIKVYLTVGLDINVPHSYYLSQNLKICLYHFLIAKCMFLHFGFSAVREAYGEDLPQNDIDKDFLLKALLTKWVLLMVINL